MAYTVYGRSESDSAKIEVLKSGVDDLKQAQMECDFQRASDPSLFKIWYEEDKPLVEMMDFEARN